MMIMNFHFKVTIRSHPAEYFQKHGLSQMDEEGYIPDFAVNFYKNDTDYQKLVSKAEPFYYSNDEVLPGEVLCQNLFNRGEFAARMIVYGFEREFQSWDSFFLKVLAEYVQLVYFNGFDQDSNEIMLN